MAGASCPSNRGISYFEYYFSQILYSSGLHVQVTGGLVIWVFF